MAASVSSTPSISQLTDSEVDESDNDDSFEAKEKIQKLSNRIS